MNNQPILKIMQRADLASCIFYLIYIYHDPSPEMKVDKNKHKN